MRVKFSNYDTEFPLSNVAVVKQFADRNCIPPMIQLDEELGQYGIFCYKDYEVLDAAILNELLYEYSELTDEEFLVVCAILETQHCGDLARLGSAVKDFQTGNFEFVRDKLKITSAHKNPTAIGYREAQTGYIRMR